MKDRQSLSAAEERQLLEHFRDHQVEQPPAALDARILAAAAAQVRQPQARGWTARLQAWLFGGVRLRWSLALGSIAALGLGLGLSLRTLEQAPARYDSPMPAAPALQRYAAPAPQENKAMAESARPAEPAASVMADSAAPAPEAAEALAPSLGKRAVARAKGEAAPRPDELHEALQQLLQLRESGQRVQAAERLDALQRRYPQVDIEAQLQRLRIPDESAR